MNSYFRKYIFSFFKSMLWIFPFLSFLAGYFIMNFFLPTNLIKVPVIVGKNVVEAFEILSSVNLTMKIIDKHQDATLKEPIITQQYPKAGVGIKSNKILNVVISEPLKPFLMPDIIAESQAHYRDTLNNYKKIVIPVITDNKECTQKVIAQWPEKNSVLESSFIVYTSASEDIFIMPSMVGESVFEVESLLNKNNIPYKLYEQKKKSHNTLLETSKIIEQQPAEGFLFSLKKPPFVHLTVE